MKILMLEQETPSSVHDKRNKCFQKEYFYSMVTALGLPLLIVNGKFQSLSSMSVEDLETFIPFLAKCSINRAGAQLINGIPEWWSSTIQYKFPLQKPKGLSQTGYRRHLSSIVCSCYWYHDAQYLLPFCAKIASSPESVFLQNNEDNTTSIFYVHNTSHVMKFNNENKNYDKKLQKEKPPRQSLLFPLPKKDSVIPDIYLCENCDAEFSSHSEMQIHEKECYKIDPKQEINVAESCKEDTQIDSSEEIEVLEHIKPNLDPSIGKNNFFNYFMLQPKTSENLQRLSNIKKIEPSWKQCGNADVCLYKNQSVEFSSDCGRKILAFNGKRDLISKIRRTFMVTEYYCSTNSTSRTNRELREPLDFRVTCKKPKKNTWTHQYCFNKQQRRNRYTTLKTGLNEHSRKLLKRCKEFQIVLNRLKVES